MKVVNDKELGLGMLPETDEQLQEFLKDKQFIHYVAMSLRPGVNECMEILEHTHYKPKTPRNDLFHFRIIEWEGIPWVMASIPIEEKHFMETVSKECGLKIANGVPTMLYQGKALRFPADNERVFTLENAPNHPVYRDEVFLKKRRRGQKHSLGKNPDES